MSQWQVFRSKRNQRQQNRQLQQFAAAVAAQLSGKGGGKQRKRREEWMCGTCGTFNWLERPSCRKCGEFHNVSPPTANNNQAPAGQGKSKGRGKGQPSLNATLTAARAQGASEETVEALKQDANHAKQERQSLGSRLDSAAAKVKRAREQLRRADDAVAKALDKQDEAAQAVANAEHELKSLKQKAAEGAAARQGEDPVAVEAQKLLEELENAPVYSTTSNSVVPERLLAQMRKLRQTLAGDDEGADAREDEHVDTADEFEERPRRHVVLRSSRESTTPGRTLQRKTASRRPHSDSPAGRRRVSSASRTPPPKASRLAANSDDDEEELADAR